MNLHVMDLGVSFKSWKKCLGETCINNTYWILSARLKCFSFRMKNGRGSRSPSEFSGSVVDGDSLRLREVSRPKLSEVKFGIKRLMDDLGKKKRYDLY